jgi:hypothetical protein
MCDGVSLSMDPVGCDASVCYVVPVVEVDCWFGVGVVFQVLAFSCEGLFVDSVEVFRCVVDLGDVCGEDWGDAISAGVCGIREKHCVDPGVVVFPMWCNFVMRCV